jgi:hypothetical protein
MYLQQVSYDVQMSHSAVVILNPLYQQWSMHANLFSLMDELEHPHGVLEFLSSILNCYVYKQSHSIKDGLHVQNQVLFRIPTFASVKSAEILADDLLF